jgi:hypothetical protein
MTGMLEVILAGNIEAGRLEAEVRDEQYNLVAIVYEDHTGWHVERHGSSRLPDGLLEQIKDKLSLHQNRKGDDPPEGMSRGEYSLWLLD